MIGSLLNMFSKVFLKKMEEILDDLLGKCTGAAILSLGGIVWYSTPGFYTNANEFQYFSNVFNEDSKSVYGGITFQNQVYLVLTQNQHTVTATTNTSFLILCKCKNCILFAYDENKTSYEKCTEAAEEAAKKLNENDFDKQNN